MNTREKEREEEGEEEKEGKQERRKSEANVFFVHVRSPAFLLCFMLYTKKKKKAKQEKTKEDKRRHVLTENEHDIGKAVRRRRE